MNRDMELLKRLDDKIIITQTNALHHHHQDHTYGDVCVAPELHHGSTVQGGHDV
jgi:hypothetical protein